MLVKDDEVKDLKAWIVKKLETISEADSQILSDYVLALLQSEGPEAELQANAVENLADFLGDNTKKFVDAVFQAIRNKTYLPGYVSAPTQAPSQVATVPSNHNRSGLRTHDNTYRSNSAGRKRSYNESNGYYVDLDAPVKKHYARDLRDSHSMRLGYNSGRGQGNLRGDNQSRYSNDSRLTPSAVHRAGYTPPILHPAQDTRTQGQRANPATLVPSLPAPGSVPFDPNAAIQAVMTLQAMGFPISVPGTGTVGGESRPWIKSRKRCRNYDNQGFCPRGASCVYQHEDKTTLGNDMNHTKASGSSILTNGKTAHSVATGSMASNESHRKKGPARAAFSAPKNDGQSGTFPGIVVENIPEDCFDYEKIEKFFSAFGSIKNIVLRAYHHLAIVEYNHLASARAAIGSPKVVFDNRFVKVFWYVPDLDDKRRNAIVGPILAQSQPEKPEFDRVEFEKANEAAQKRHEARLALLEEKRNQRSEIAAKREELEKQKAQEIQKLKAAFRERGEDLPVEIEAAIKDTSNGDETETLLAQLKALEDEAKILGIDAEPWLGDGRGSRYGGRGVYRGWRGSSSRGRGRGGYHRGGPIANGAYNLDNRPKAVKVEGIDFDDLKDERLKQYLLTLGDFVSVEAETERKSQVITFKDRASAETFFYGGRDIPGVGMLQFSWVKSEALSSAREDMDDDMKEVTYQSSTERGNMVEPPELQHHVSDTENQRDNEANNDSGEDYEWIS